MTDALTLAKYIVTKCVNDGCPISNLQLQEILYFIQVDTLKRTGKPAFPDSIEAWQFGPAISRVYYYFCRNGALSIFDTFEKVVPTIGENNYIKKIVEEERAKPPLELIDKACEPGRAWALIFQHGRGSRKIIPVDLIRNIG